MPFILLLSACNVQSMMYFCLNLFLTITPSSLSVCLSLRLCPLYIRNSTPIHSREVSQRTDLWTLLLKIFLSLSRSFSLLSLTIYHLLPSRLCLPVLTSLYTHPLSWGVPKPVRSTLLLKVFLSLSRSFSFSSLTIYHSLPPSRVCPPCTYVTLHPSTWVRRLLL